MAELKFANAGLFVSNGKGCHVTRIPINNEIILVKSGTLHIRAGNRHFAVTPGQWLILYKGIEHGGTENYEKKLSFFWGHFSGGEELLASCAQYGTSGRKDYFMQYFSMLINEQKFADSQKSCDLLMQLLLQETCRKNPLESSAENSSLAANAKRLLDLNFASPLSSAEIARELNCNVDYLGRLFRKEFNCSMMQYLNKIRCREAAYLLQTSTSSIKEIAFFSGFNDLPFFRKQFFRFYSATPGQYRKMYRPARVNTMNV